MTKQNNAARVAVQAEPCQNAAPIDLHAMFRQNISCGFDQPLTLAEHETQEIASRLRSITTLSALLMAAGDSERLKLSDWMRGGIVEAMHCLASDAGNHLEECAVRASKKGDA